MRPGISCVKIDKSEATVTPSGTCCTALSFIWSLEVNDESVNCEFAREASGCVEPATKIGDTAKNSATVGRTHTGRLRTWMRRRTEGSTGASEASESSAGLRAGTVP